MSTKISCIFLVMLYVMEDFFDQFRMNLKYYREQKNWSQRELYIQSGVSSGNIGSIEAGNSKPSFEVIVKLAAALKIHPADLFLRDCSIQKNELKKELEKILTKDIRHILETRF